MLVYQLGTLVLRDAYQIFPDHEVGRGIVFLEFDTENFIISYHTFQRHSNRIVQGE